MIDRIAWSKVTSFSEGTEIFIAGLVSLREGRPVFVEGEAEPLIAVSYDGDRADLLPRLVASGRKRIDLGGRMTLLFWALGFGLISGFFVYFSNLKTVPSIQFLAYLVAFAPILPFAPPGMVFLFLSNVLWRYSLRLRMEYDLATLGGSGARPRRSALAIALSALLVGLALVGNFILAFLIYRLAGA